MTRALVEFLLASAPKMNKETATAAFVESRSDDATELAKTAVRAKIGDVAERNVNDRRWEIKPEGRSPRRGSPRNRRRRCARSWS